MDATNSISFPSQTFPQLEALNHAHKILILAKAECAAYAADQPWTLLAHARDYIDKQAHELIAPIFAKEEEPEALAREVANLVATTKECRCENNGDYCEWCSIQFDYMQADLAERQEMLNNARGQGVICG